LYKPTDHPATIATASAAPCLVFLHDMENGLSLAAAGEIFLLDGRQRPAYEIA
jgi:hypothetical protein